MSEQRAPDALDQAIAKAAAPVEQRFEVRIGLLKQQDRIVIMNLPADITDLELLALIGATLTVGDQLRARRHPQIAIPQLVLPTQ